jgi:Na+/proline symporter
MGIFSILAGVLLLLALLWAARVNYSSGKAGTRRPGRGTLLFSVAISILAGLAFTFVVERGSPGSEVDGLLGVAGALVFTAIVFNLYFSAYLLGILSRDPQGGRSAAPPEDANDQAHA